MVIHSSEKSNIRKGNMIVEKRDGTKVAYDAAKIKQSIAHAVGETGANNLVLESMMDAVIKNGIKTSSIQENVIRQAVQLATPTNPEWLKVGGRAYAANMWANFKLKDKSFLDIIKYNVKKKEYTKEILDFYTDEQINELGKYIKIERDLDHSYASLLTVDKKYLGKYELNQHMHMVNAMRFGQLEPENTRVERVKQFYDVFSLRKLSPATPFMNNLRKGGNVASCFIIAIEDDLDSIFDNVKRMAKISKNGGGIGVFLGYLRAKGSSVAGYEGAAGVITQWAKIINDTMVAVNQGGKRAGAATVALPIWHNDIQDFLDMQTEHGDLRLKAYDVFPQVTVPDLFMQRDKEQKPFVTFCPYEVREKLGIDIRGLYNEQFEEAYAKIETAFYAGKLKVAKEISNARDLMKIIMRSQFDSGLPFLSFTDEMNRRNPNKGHKGSYGIVCANLCVESYSNTKPDVYGHVCNLASINLANIDSLKELAEVSRIAARILDYGISLTNAPDGITSDHNDEFRTIGIGIMGLNDYLAKNKLNYRSLTAIRELSEIIELSAATESVELAKEFGTFNAFKDSTWASGEQTKYFASNSKHPECWEALQQEINKYGIRNSQLTSPAPTTSTSIYQEASATFLPVYEKFFSEDNKNGAMSIAAKYLKEHPEGYARDLPQFDALEIIDVASELQKYIDTGISMELMFDQNKVDFKAKDLYDAIHYAHKKKCKTIYYIRSIKKNASVAVKESACESCES
jgi:ribonucleoside-diphosphate reductase alpha chain